MSNEPEFNILPDQEASSLLIEAKKPLDPRIIAGRATKAKHSSMIGKTFTLKLQSNHLSIQDNYDLNLLFTETKWFYNYCINHVKTINSVDTTLKSVPVKVLDKEQTRTFKLLSGQMKQEIKKRVLSNLKALRTVAIKEAKKPKSKQNMPGELQFKSEVNSVPLSQYGDKGVYRLDFVRSTLKLQNMKTWLKINGLNQIPKDADICNAVLYKHNGSFYLKVMTYVPMKPRKSMPSGIPEGIDFGCSTQITTSSGLKFNWNLPVDRGIKRLDRKCTKKRMKHLPKLPKTKGKPDPNKRPDSKNRRKDYIRKAKKYEKLTNRRTDTRNKVVSFLTNNFSIIIMQDDSIKSWQSGRHGKKINSTGIGGIKTALRDKAETSIMIPQHYPSTKTCSNCGCKQDVPIDMRTYSCVCGFACCRDINGARSIKNEGILLNSKTIIQNNKENAYHTKKEEDMKRESDKIKQREQTKEKQKEWIELVGKKDEQKLGEIMVFIKRIESYLGMYGAYRSDIFPFCSIKFEQNGKDIQKLGEKSTSAFMKLMDASEVKKTSMTQEAPSL